MYEGIFRHWAECPHQAVGDQTNGKATHPRANSALGLGDFAVGFLFALTAILVRRYAFDKASVPRPGLEASWSIRADGADYLPSFTSLETLIPHYLIEFEHEAIHLSFINRKGLLADRLIRSAKKLIYY